MKKKYESPKAKITSISVEEDILEPSAEIGTSTHKRDEEEEPVHG